jgi:hypothetical protein
MIFRPVSNAVQRLDDFAGTHNPSHSKPHAKPSPEFLANKERQNAPRKGSQVVYRHDDALERTAWVSEGVAPVFVAYDA